MFFAVEQAWCPVCRKAPGEPCSMTRTQSEATLAAIAGGGEPPALAAWARSADGRQQWHRARVERAKRLIEGQGTWRRDELVSVVSPLIMNGGLELAEI